MSRFFDERPAYSPIRFRETGPPTVSYGFEDPHYEHGDYLFRYYTGSPAEAPRDSESGELYLPDGVLRYSPLLERYTRLGNKVIVPHQIQLYSTGRGMLGTSSHSIDARRRAFLFLVGNGFSRSAVVDILSSWVPQFVYYSAVAGTNTHRQAISQMIHGFYIMLDKGFYYQREDQYGVIHQGHSYYDVITKTVRPMHEGLQASEGLRRAREDVESLELVAALEASVQ